MDYRLTRERGVRVPTRMVCGSDILDIYYRSETSLTKHPKESYWQFSGWNIYYTYRISIKPQLASKTSLGFDSAWGLVRSLLEFSASS